MNEVKLLVRVKQEDITDNGDGTLTLQGAKTVEIGEQPVFEAINDIAAFESPKGVYDREVDYQVIPSGTSMELIACDLHPGGISPFDVVINGKEQRVWILTEGNVKHVSGRLGIRE